MLCVFSGDSNVILEYINSHVTYLPKVEGDFFIMAISRQTWKDNRGHKTYMGLEVEIC